jgi:hypothetical protein
MNSGSATGFGTRADAGPSSGRPVNRHRPINDMDMVSVCSTCFLLHLLELEQRRGGGLLILPSTGKISTRRAAYGGVRISYVPNDALALASARQRSQTLQTSATGLSSRAASSGGDK